MVIRRVQEKKERERQTATLGDEREDEVQERGVVEAAEEKPMKEREVLAEKKDEDVQVLTKSVRSLSL